MSSKYKVLVIDDDPMITKMAQRYLSENYDVMVAENGRQGLGIANSTLPDIILLDLQIPDSDGFEVCQLLRSSDLTRDIPIIVVTGNSQVQNRVRIFGTGADDYVQKPFNIFELIARVDSKVRRLKEKQVLQPVRT